VETGLVLDDHVEGLRIGVGDLLEEDAVNVAVDGWGEDQLGVMRAIYLQRFI
jgi:hypothetical protein